MERLGQPAAPTFEMCQVILQLTEQVKFYMVLLDLESPELIEGMFNTLINCARCGGRGRGYADGPHASAIACHATRATQPSTDTCRMHATIGSFPACSS